LTRPAMANTAVRTRNFIPAFPGCERSSTGSRELRDRCGSRILWWDGPGGGDEFSRGSADAERCRLACPGLHAINIARPDRAGCRWRAHGQLHLDSPPSNTGGAGGEPLSRWHIRARDEGRTRTMSTSANCEFRENSHRDSIWESSLNSQRVPDSGEALRERPTAASNQRGGTGGSLSHRPLRQCCVDGIVLRSSEDPRPGLREILMRVRASSLNYRDLMVLKGGGRGPTKLGVVPLSDGAGEVAAIGDGVTRVKIGDRIAGTFHPRWFGGPIRPEYLTDRLGANLDGMLAEYAVLGEESLVHVPSHLSFEEAATLPCAAVTAWVALTGHRRVTAGDTVLTLGSGGVSVFALQFARVLGARVIATTSTAEKAERLKALGASEVINYAETPDWDVKARELTDGCGVDCVVEIGGPGTIARSLKALAVRRTCQPDRRSLSPSGTMLDPLS